MLLLALLVLLSVLICGKHHHFTRPDLGTGLGKSRKNVVGPEPSVNVDM